LSERGPRKALRDLLYQLIAFLKTTRLYPPHHPRRSAAAEQLITQLNLFVSCRREARVEVCRQELTLNGEAFDRSDPVVSSFIPKLMRRGIGTLTFLDGITEPELNTLSDLLKSDNETLRSRGGAEGFLRDQGARHLEVKGFFAFKKRSGSAGNAGASGADAGLRNASGPASEAACATEENVDYFERILKKRLRSHPGIREDMDWIEEALDQAGLGGRVKMQSEDLLLFLAGKAASGGEAAEQESVDPVEAIAHVLRRIRRRLQEETSSAETSRQGEIQGVRRILDQVAAQMTAGPQALFDWVAKETDCLQIDELKSMGEWTKAAFVRTGPNRAIAFGETELRSLVLDKRDGDGAKPAVPRKPRGEEPALAEIKEKLAALRDRNDKERFPPLQQQIDKGHLDVLLELLHQEEDVKAKPRIIQALQEFLIAQGDDGAAALPEIFGGPGKSFFRLPRDDQGAILKSSALFQRAILRFLRGDEALQNALSTLARNDAAFFAERLEAEVLERVEPGQLAALGDLIENCRERFIPLLEARIMKSEAHLLSRTLVDLVLRCASSHSVHLIGMLLKKVRHDVYSELVAALIRIDSVPALKMLGSETRNPDPLRRRRVFMALGESPHPMAEQLLLDAIGGSPWPGRMHGDRLAALQALKGKATNRAAAVLRKIAWNPLLVFSPAGRALRQTAREVRRGMKEKGPRSNAGEAVVQSGEDPRE